jgi:hypothetical protein
MAQTEEAAIVSEERNQEFRPRQIWAPDY